MQHTLFKPNMINMKVTVPNAVALMNYMRSQVVYFGGVLAKLGLFAGFSLLYTSEAAMGRKHKFF